MQQTLQTSTPAALASLWHDALERADDWIGLDAYRFVWGEDLGLGWKKGGLCCHGYITVSESVIVIDNLVLCAWKRKWTPALCFINLSTHPHLFLVPTLWLPNTPSLYLLQSWLQWTGIPVQSRKVAELKCRVVFQHANVCHWSCQLKLVHKQYFYVVD